MHSLLELQATLKYTVVLLLNAVTYHLESGSNSTVQHGLTYHTLLNLQEQRRENKDPKGSHWRSGVGA